MEKIRVAVIGVGNCASSLIQGISYYQALDKPNRSGIMNWEIGRYKPYDIEIVLAYDIDKRKVGCPLDRAIFAKPNCTKKFQEVITGKKIIVKMGCIFDGVPSHMDKYPVNDTFQLSRCKEPSQTEVIEELKKTKTDILINYLPVGSQRATEFYMNCALEAKVGVVNCIPVFIASSPFWAKKFKEKKIPIIGDDIKAQLGSTIIHRSLIDLIKKRGGIVEKTYQLNVGGNTDFLNMLDRGRLDSKKISKTSAVKSQFGNVVEDNNIHIGPSDYIPWLNDNKLAFIRIDGTLFGNIPFNIELKLSVEDSPNSSGIAIDAIRCCKLAYEQGLSGPIIAPSAYFMKHPPLQMEDNASYIDVLKFINHV